MKRPDIQAIFFFFRGIVTSGKNNHVMYHLLIHRIARSLTSRTATQKAVPFRVSQKSHRLHILFNDGLSEASFFI